MIPVKSPATRTRMTAGLLAAVAVLGVCGAATAEVRFVYQDILDVTAAGAERLRPVAITCDPLNGEICITDDRQSLFALTNTDGIQIFRTGAFAGLSFPLDGSLDRDGGIVFLDSDGDYGFTIKRLDLFGEPVDFAAQPVHPGWAPRYLIITRDGNFVTLDAFRGTLAKHDSRSGEVIWVSTVTNDSGSDVLHLGRPAEAEDGRLYIPGGNLNRVLVFTADGRNDSAFGRYGTGPGRMIFPVGAAFLPDGTFLMLDRMRHKIMVFDADHQFLGEYGSLGAGPGQFYHPSSLATDHTGRCFVGQGFQGRVQVFKVEIS